MNRSVLILLACMVTTPVFAQETFEYHGYMRSGFGFSRGGTDQACFRAPGTEGASGKHRLGNECETYIEISFTKYHLLGKTRDEPTFSTHFTLAAQSNGHRDWEPDNSNFDDKTKSNSEEFLTALREAYVKGHNLFGKGGPSPWIGKRFYRRYDIHMLDYYLIDNAGPGAGLEGISLGGPELHFAVTRNIPMSHTDDGPAQTNVDVRATGIPAPGGSLETVVIYGASGKRGNYTGDDKWKSLNGTQVALIHGLEVPGGFNKLALQYGQGIFGANGAWGQGMLNQWGAWGSQNIAKDDEETFDARKKSSTLRLSDQFVRSGETFSYAFVLLYQNADFGGAKHENGEEVPNKVETTFGARPIYHLSKVTSLALELGVTSVKAGIAPKKPTDPGYDPNEKEWKDATLQKITLAPQFTAGDGYWARPQLRLFATYAKWNEESKGQVAAPVYAQATSGFSTGVQLEAWW